MVKLGMKSVPGSNSSRNAKTPPSIPFQLPNVAKKIIPEMGAQTRSSTSPIRGKLYVAKPTRSISMQNTSEGSRLFAFIDIARFDITIDLCFKKQTINDDE